MREAQATRRSWKKFLFGGRHLENLAKRPLAESKALLRIYETYFKKLTEAAKIFT
jgi:hypothetical protein